MDPNSNNQPINANLSEQPVVPQSATQPVIAQEPIQPTPIPTPPMQPTQTNATPIAGQEFPGGSKNNRKIVILMILLILIILGIAGYVFFARNQLSQQASTNSSTVAPIISIEPTATPVSIDEIEIASPEADLELIENDVQGL